MLKSTLMEVNPHACVKMFYHPFSTHWRSRRWGKMICIGQNILYSKIIQCFRHAIHNLFTKGQISCITMSKKYNCFWKCLIVCGFTENPLMHISLAREKLTKSFTQFHFSITVMAIWIFLYILHMNTFVYVCT